MCAVCTTSRNPDPRLPVFSFSSSLPSSSGTPRRLRCFAASTAAFASSSSSLGGAGLFFRSFQPLTPAAVPLGMPSAAHISAVFSVVLPSTPRRTFTPTHRGASSSSSFSGLPVGAEHKRYGVLNTRDIPDAPSATRHSATACGHAICAVYGRFRSAPFLGTTAPGGPSPCDPKRSSARAASVAPASAATCSTLAPSARCRAVPAPLYTSTCNHSMLVANANAQPLARATTAEPLRREARAY